MRIITEKKCISEIRNMIVTAKDNVRNGRNEYKEFDFVYDYMVFSQKCGLLKKKTLDMLWRELQEATTLV